MIRAVLWIALLAQEPVPHRQDRPPNPPRSPEEALRHMAVPEGFTVEIVAAEPDVVNPVAMCFDGRGRIWVCESVEYPRRAAGEGRDRVKILEDADGDGRAEKVTVFADKLNIPSGIAIGWGGVWVLNAPDLLFFREENGRAAGREVVVTGFGRADTHELPNSLTWGPDGWLYGLNGIFNPSRVGSGKRDYDFTGAMWRVHPRTRAFEVVCEGTSNPWGVCWDPEGSAIVSACHWAKDHVFHFVETGQYQRQAGAYPPWAWKLGSISDHGHQKTAYCGIAYLDSDAYPAKYRDRLYIGNIHGGAINTDVLRRDGSTYVASAEPDLLQANDAWFMPVAQKVGPDGCLYVLDWYDRYHCYQDAGRDPAGVDRQRGRLYRIRYRDSPRAPRLDLSEETDDQLIARLGSPNIFLRESAQRLLAERGAAGAKLQAVALDELAPRKASLHALWALVGAGPLDPGFHARVLAHRDPTFRAWGVRAAGNARQVEPAIREKIASLAQDLSRDVQLQVAVAALKIEGLDPAPVLIDVLERCGTDRLIPAIVWQNLHPILRARAGVVVERVRQADFAKSPALAAILPRAVERLLAGDRFDPVLVRFLLEKLVERDPEVARTCLAAVAGGAVRWSSETALEMRSHLGPMLQTVLEGPESALKMAARPLAARLGIPGAGDVVRLFRDPLQPSEVRLQALEVLLSGRRTGVADVAVPALEGSPPEFASRVLAALGRSEEPRLADAILGLYPKLPAELQPLAVDLLMQREPWARKLLDAAIAGKFPREALHANHLRKILETNDREAIWAVEKVWGKVREERNPDRERVVREMGEHLRANPGDPRAGAAVFRKLCVQCHAIHGEGRAVGPDLTSNGRASFDQLLANVFDPSQVIGQGYQVTTVITTGGRNVTGLVVEDNDQRVVLKMQGGETETIPRAAVKVSRVSRLSMMPEGIETSVDARELADLFAFLSLDLPPENPRAKPIPGAPVRKER